MGNLCNHARDEKSEPQSPLKESIAQPVTVEHHSKQNSKETPKVVDQDSIDQVDTQKVGSEIVGMTKNELTVQNDAKVAEESSAQQSVDQGTEERAKIPTDNTVSLPIAGFSESTVVGIEGKSVTQLNDKPSSHALDSELVVSAVEEKSSAQPEDEAKTSNPDAGSEVLVDKDTLEKSSIPKIDYQEGEIKSKGDDAESVIPINPADSALVISTIEDKPSTQEKDASKNLAPTAGEELLLNEDTAKKPSTPTVLDQEVESKENEGDINIINSRIPTDKGLAVSPMEEKSAKLEDKPTTPAVTTENQVLLNETTVEKPTTQKVVDEGVSPKTNLANIKVESPITLPHTELVVSPMEEKSSIQNEDKSATANLVKETQVLPSEETKVDKVLPKEEKEMKVKEEPVVVDQDNPSEEITPIGESAFPLIPKYNGINVPDAEEKSSTQKVDDPEVIQSEAKVADGENVFPKIPGYNGLDVPEKKDNPPAAIDTEVKLVDQGDEAEANVPTDLSVTQQIPEDHGIAVSEQEEKSYEQERDEVVPQIPGYNSLNVPEATDEKRKPQT